MVHSSSEEMAFETAGSLIQAKADNISLEWAWYTACRRAITGVAILSPGRILFRSGYLLS